MTNRNQRYYVGVSLTSRIVFRSAANPTDTGTYNYVIGPFRSKGAALLMARYGFNNPHMNCVASCELLNKALPTKWYKMQGWQPNQHLNRMEPIAE